MQFFRHILIFVGNALPRYHVIDHVRTRLYRWAGIRIGAHTRIAGPLILDLSLRRNTLRSIEIGSNVYVNYQCRIAASNSFVRIGDNCLIGPNVSFETAQHSPDPATTRMGAAVDAAPITVGANVWIGANALILPGVDIGENTVVAAGAVVTKSTPPGQIIGGVPARALKAAIAAPEV